jgi:hypothetical protein
VKVALITTTINVPRVLSLYRAHDPDVMFFVAGDQKTPQEAYEFCDALPNCWAYGCAQQKHMEYKSSELIGWNTDSRRNIALLEALKWGADIIVSIDDDMIPMNSNWSFFWGWYGLLGNPYHGLQLGFAKQWFNVGACATPVTNQRGLPYDTLFYTDVTFITDAQIGVAQGIILGVPDCDAANAITNKPMIINTSDVLRAGFVVDPAARAVFNSQITAFRRELAPAFAQLYSAQGRNTDIFASLLMRRIMRERNLYTYFGPPAAFHARQSRPLLPDLRNEMIGNERIAEFAEYLDRAPIPGESVVTDVGILVAGFDQKLFPPAFWEAWLNDCVDVL